MLNRKRFLPFIQFSKCFAFASHYFGGPDGIRTRDLLVANEALYQLSYRPILVVLYKKSAGAT